MRSKGLAVLPGVSHLVGHRCCYPLRPGRGPSSPRGYLPYPPLEAPRTIPNDVLSESSPSQWIEGFDFEEGFRYRIEVERREVADPPADGSSLSYRLLRVLSRERAAG